MDELLEQFLIEGPELVHQAADDLLALERSPADLEALNSAFRAVHTLKGSVGLFDIAPMGALLQAAEDLLVAVRGDVVAITKPVIDDLLASVGQCERWLDDLADGGALGPGAEAASERLAALLRAHLSAGPTAARPHVAAEWAADLVRLHGDKMTGGAVALRYVPDAQAYFNGDDPLGLARTAPGLLVLSAALNEPIEGDYDPFTCNIVIEALYQAPLDAVQSAFRLVRDQVTLVEVAAPGVTARADASRTLRIDASRIDALADLVGELVVAKNGLAEIMGAPGVGGLRETYLSIDRLAGALHRRVMEMRLTSLSPVLRRLRPLAREIASSLGKDVEFIIDDHQTEADKSIVDGLYEPLLHILRNAIDHGLETTPERLAAGKPRSGRVTLTARPVGGQVMIEVTDDGRGIDPQTIRRVAAERGVMSEEALAALSDADAIDLIFAAGFSTARTVSAISGRGVGMDAVRAAVSRMGGRVSIRSAKGQGATFVLALPLTLVMTKIMIVACGAERFGAPLDAISETLQLKRDEVFPVRHGQAFVLRGEPVPLLYLSELLGSGARRDQQDAKVLVTGSGDGRLGIAVDQLLGRTDVIMRPMSGLLAGAPGVAGTTLTGDGQVLLILDLAELAQ